jgi:hypothetical protein
VCEFSWPIVSGGFPDVAEEITGVLPGLAPRARGSSLTCWFPQPIISLLSLMYFMFHRLIYLIELHDSTSRWLACKMAIVQDGSLWRPDWSSDVHHTKSKFDIDITKTSQNRRKQAGAELWQAQFKLGRAKPALPFTFSVAFSCIKSDFVVNWQLNLVIFYFLNKPSLSSIYQKKLRRSSICLNIEIAYMYYTN